MDTSLTTSENSTCSTVVSCPITNDNNSSDDGIDDTPTLQYVNSNNNNNNNNNNNDKRNNTSITEYESNEIVCFNCYVSDDNVLSEELFPQKEEEEEEEKEEENDPVVCFNCYVDPKETHALSEQVFSSAQKEEEEVKDVSPNSNNNPNSDDSSIQLSSDSSTEMFSLSTLDDSLSSYFIKTPRRIETSKSSSNTHNKESDISSELPPETPEIASTPFSKTPSVPSIIKKSAIAKSLFPFSRSTDTSHQEEEDSTGSNCFLQTSYDEGVEEDENENEHRCCSLYENDEEEEEIDLPITKLKESRMSKVKESSMSKVNLLYDNDQVISIQFGDGTDVRFSMDSTAEIEDDDQLHHQAASSSVVSNTEGWERGGWGPTTVQDEKGAPPSREHSLDDWKSTTFSVHEMATQTEISFRDNKRKHGVSWKTCCGAEDEEYTMPDNNAHQISQSQGGNAGCRWSCALI